MADKSYQIDLNTTASGDGAEALAQQIAASRAELIEAAKAAGATTEQLKELEAQFEKSVAVATSGAGVPAIKKSLDEATASAKILGEEVRKAAAESTSAIGGMSLALGAFGGLIGGLVMAHWRRMLHVVKDIGTALGESIFNPVNWVKLQKDIEKSAEELRKGQAEALHFKREIDGIFSEMHKAKDEAEKLIEKLEAAARLSAERAGRAAREREAAKGAAIAATDADDDLTGPQKVAKKIQIEKAARDADFEALKAELEAERNRANIAIAAAAKKIRDMGGDDPENKKFNAEAAAVATRAAIEERDRLQKQFEEAAKEKAAIAAPREHRAGSLLPGRSQEDYDRDVAPILARAAEINAKQKALGEAHPELRDERGGLNAKDAEAVAKKTAMEAKAELERMQKDLAKAKAERDKAEKELESDKKIHADREREEESRAKIALQNADSKEGKQEETAEKKETRQEIHKLKQELDGKKEKDKDNTNAIELLIQDVGRDPVLKKEFPQLVQELNRIKAEVGKHGENESTGLKELNRMISTWHKSQTGLTNEAVDALKSLIPMEQNTLNEIKALKDAVRRLESQVDNT